MKSAVNSTVFTDAFACLNFAFFFFEYNLQNDKEDSQLLSHKHKEIGKQAL